MKVGMNRRKNELAKHATKSRRVRIDGGRWHGSLVSDRCNKLKY
jgi:hypothetical protein